MLILSRKNGQSIVIGEAVTVTVVQVRGRVVRLGIEAPHEVHVRRTELEWRMPQAAKARLPAR